MIGSGPKRLTDTLEAAASWDARLRSPTASDEDRRHFGEWLEEGPSHARAFDDLQASLSALREAASGHPELRAMRDAAREMASSPQRWQRYGAVAACVAVLLGGAVTLNDFGKFSAIGSRADHSERLAVVSTSRSLGQVYRTAVGERSVVTLADGSRITLNTASLVSVLLEPHRRNVVVVSGQAMFEVAKDEARPFIVRAGNRIVTAHGTAFDVWLRPGGMEVTLIEGRVTVADVSGTTSHKIADLRPGQQFASSGTDVTVHKIDAEKETSWRDGRIFIEDQHLTSAVIEMNRYSPTKIVADPDLAHLRINGMFKAGQQISFARTLEAYLPVKAAFVWSEPVDPDRTPLRDPLLITITGPRRQLLRTKAIFFVNVRSCRARLRIRSNSSQPNLP